MTFAEVILPLPLEGTFTYALPEELAKKATTGQRAVVSFGKTKIYTGILHSIHTNAPDHDPKEILDLLDEHPILTPPQLAFFNWIGAYYMCSIGQVMSVGLPAALKLASESYVALNPEVLIEDATVDEREGQLLGVLQKKDLSLKEAGQVLGLVQPYKVLKNLAELGYIDIYEKVKDKYQPKTEKRIRIAEMYLLHGELEKLLNDLESKPKQQDVLLSYLKKVPLLEDIQSNEQGMLKSELLSDDISPSSLQTLIKKGVLENFDKKTSRLATASAITSPAIPTLSGAQEDALSKINKDSQDCPVSLLHGITGSGKTEIYIQLIRKHLEKGEQVLYLLPEIALTTQIISRLHKLFGDSFGVYHSRYSDNERVEVWQKILQKEYLFVVGVRSAIFLPFSNLKLVIVDEEHEPSYKSFERAPRYHARDAALYLARLHDAKVVLGSATPSLESYQNALHGKYNLVTLSERYGQGVEPELIFANTSKERKQRKLKGNFSSDLVSHIQQILDKKQQAILFQNRRGYATYISCDHCAAIPKCPHCAVSLTYHQYNHKLICHYCGFNQSMYKDCLHCGHEELKQVGFGTEELEEELNILFPSAIVQRMDLDTTRSKYSYQRIIEAFEEGAIDLLVGTQMVSKGLDFDKVNLVGIFDTDRMIHFPDFRSHERAYQLITQVSGRAGRKSQEGRVVIQTADPDQPLLQRVKQKDYLSFFQWEIMERERFHYPPFTRMITITCRHREKSRSFQSSQYFAAAIRKQLGAHKIIGPVAPLIGKIRNHYLHEITLKLDKQGVNLPWVKKHLRSTAQLMMELPQFKGVGVVFDVDPV